jgi:calcineurin-like phosphoesterase family protein
MSKIFFTADCHFNHENIIKYAERPFKNLQHMHAEIIERWNKKVNENDIVYHVGDFAFKGVNQAQLFESMLNGRIVHIRGNHDKNNGVKTLLTHCIMEFGGLIFYVTHRPPDEFQERTIEETITAVSNIILCGHVHSYWKHKIIKNKICINVGVDVWNFEPISLNTILKYIGKIKGGHI